MQSKVHTYSSPYTDFGPGPSVPRAAERATAAVRRGRRAGHISPRATRTADAPQFLSLSFPHDPSLIELASVLTASPRRTSDQYRSMGASMEGTTHLAANEPLASRNPQILMAPSTQCWRYRLVSGHVASILLVAKNTISIVACRGLRWKP